MASLESWFFRVWDKEEKVMYYPTLLPCSSGIDLKNKEGTKGMVIGPDILAFVKENADKFVFMKCSGFEDINGTLVYEGDLVANNYDKTHSRELFYDDAEACFKMKNGTLPGDNCQIDQQWIRECEVFVSGNIFESPVKEDEEDND